MYAKSSANDEIKDFFTYETLTTIMIENFSDDDMCSKQEKRFCLFLDIFGKSIAGASNYNDKEKKKEMFQDSCTASDEAFGIFTIERCWHTWMKEIVHGKEGVAHRESEYVKKNSNKKYAGWKNNGLKRFSDLASAVLIARKSDQRKNMEESYRQTLIKNDETDEIKENDDYARSTCGNFEQKHIFVPYNDLPVTKANCDVTNANNSLNFVAYDEEISDDCEDIEQHHSNKEMDETETPSETGSDTDENDSEEEESGTEDFEDSQDEQTPHAQSLQNIFTSTSSPEELQMTSYFMNQIGKFDSV